MFRREFLRLASLAAGAVPFSSVQGFSAVRKSGGVSGEDSPRSANLYQIFQNPPLPYRPMVRWWWNGDRVTADEVTRELDLMLHNGIGGVEINPIRFPGHDNPIDSKALTWGSPEWLAVVKVAIQACKQRGMTCDMIVGSGWPYGGEFLAPPDQTQMITPLMREFTGPRHVRLTVAEILADVPHNLISYKGAIKELFSLSLAPYELSDVHTATTVPWNHTADAVEFDVPAGRHVLYSLVKLTGSRQVINGAPGAAGPQLNHYSGEAVERYLDRFGKILTGAVGPLGESFRAFFTDSIELEGANWCDDMFAEFQRRRGYDLQPWFPFVLFKTGEMGNAVKGEYGARFTPELLEQTQLVRYDFETTRHELFQERFVGTFVKWCGKVGVKSRMQAYGMDCDAITAGMMLDIPECETWIWTERIDRLDSEKGDGSRNYTMINKFVSSAAHLAGKRLISCEEMTNTDDPFHASLDRIKAAGDLSVLSGVTQSVLHGLNYSPLAVPFPGWVRYGTYFNERNTWWPYFHLWAAYKARLSALFQHADMQAEIAILPANADLASKYGFQRDPFPRVVYPPYLHKIWEAVHQNGSGCDYLNEEIVAQSTCKDGKLIFRNRAYKAILLPAVESIHPATAKQLQSFVESGGTVIFIDKTPHLSDGLVEHAQQSREVLDIITALRGKYPDRTPLVSMQPDNMHNWYRDLQQRYHLRPEIEISEPASFISQLHYRSGDKDIFFFINDSPADHHSMEVKFPTAEKVPWLWDTETGTRVPCQTGRERNVLTLTLAPIESRLIVFEPPSSLSGTHQPPQPVNPHLPGPDAHETVLSGPWQVELSHVDGAQKTITLPELVDFNSRDDLKAFAGTIVYRKQLRIETPGLSRWLNLGHIHAVSEVEINGRSLGVRWYGEHLYDLSHAVNAGQNSLSIKVITTLGNYMKTLTSNPVAQDWTSHTPFYPLGLLPPVRLLEGK